MKGRSKHPAHRLAHGVAALLWMGALLSGAPAFGDATTGPATTSPATTTSAPIEAPTLSLSPSLSPNSVDDELAEVAARPAGLLKYGPVSLLDPAIKGLNEELDKIGLKFGLAYTMVFQAASNGPGNRTAAGGDLDFFGNWRLLGKKGDPNIGLLYFSGEYRASIGDLIAPGQLGGQIGSLWGTTNGFGEQVPTVKELYWEQRFGGDLAIFRIGKLDPENFYNSNYWQSDNLYFLNQAFSSFPVRAFPSPGLGFNLTIKPCDLWYISTGVQDAQGKKTMPGFDTFFGDANMFSAFEAGWTPKFEGLGTGVYRLTAWYRDAGESDGKPHDAGLDLSIEQRVGPNLIPFFRYGTGEGNINGIVDMISTGAGWQGKLLTESDVLGAAGSWGRPANHSLHDQFAAEVFYRMQVSPDNQFTIGYQVIVDPSNDPGSAVVGVFELRWRISF